MTNHVPSVQEVVDLVAKRLLGSRIIQNSMRGDVLETIVDAGLGPPWRHCSGDWAAWDFRRDDGVRIQVKQSAAAQSWDPDPSSGVQPPTRKPSAVRYSIDYRSGFFEGAKWIRHQGRHAEVFIFAWHGETREFADQRDAEQWAFFVIAEHSLPALQKSVTLTWLLQRVLPVGIRDLRRAVDECALAAKAHDGASA